MLKEGGKVTREEGIISCSKGNLEMAIFDPRPCRRLLTATDQKSISSPSLSNWDTSRFPQRTRIVRPTPETRVWANEMSSLRQLKCGRAKYIGLPYNAVPFHALL